MKKIIKLIKKSQKIALFSHISPDPDTIGSTLALYEVLKNMGKEVSVFCDDENLDKFAFLDAEKIYNKNENNIEFDLTIAVDIATLDRIGKFADMFQKSKNNIRIDHHKSGDDFAYFNHMIPYSACGILIYELTKKIKQKITQKIATLLYFAICGDTGGFRFNNTDALTFEVCAKLLKAGADIRFLYDNFFDKKTVPSLKLTSAALLDAKINDEKKFVVMMIKKDDYQKYEASESEYVGNLPNLYLNCGYKIAAIIKEKSDGIRVSLRSKFEYDCSLIAEKFGGGGHKNASGISINDKPLNEVEKEITKAIEDFLTETQKEEV